eukprot:NODE_946_length_1300_cov_281.594378.p1 GENE.NODE_946_length_1300_cov_281.594378~~NODE_946_length_1300_cov_281.594378.p1  ORF type:complete len:287 (-),score=73.23 NODE_946_length_1300_cov_281.594378:421-1167(-)
MLHGALVDPTSGEIGLVVEHVAGTQLRAYIVESRPPIGVEVRYSLALQICCALRFLHGQHPCIVHGDLKASNIMVERTGPVGSSTPPRAKLLDFGLSRIITRGARPLGGTTAWMAPELLTKTRCRPHASADVFSFGCVLFHVMTGMVPLKGIARADVVKMWQHRTSTSPMIWPPESAFRDEGSALCQEMMDFQPSQRPHMSAVHHRLVGWRPVGLVAEVVLSTEAGPNFTAGIRQARMRLRPARRSLV